MSVLQIEERKAPKRFALFELGFRPFFLLASLYAVVSATLWLAVYFFGAPLVPAGLPSTYWHAHEMVFGYGFAVVAGFLLTVVHNWTGIQTIQNGRLATLVVLWLAGRLCYLFHAPWMITAAFDLLFALGLLIAATGPLYQARQWRNLSIFPTKVVLMGLANLLFYLGAAGLLAEGLRWGLYTGLYLLVALIFTMARRVVPFFIERGIGYPLQLRNSKIADLTSLFGLLGLWVAEMLAPASAWTVGLALITAGAQVVRLNWWYARGMWSKPLIWVLWGGLAWVTLGLLMKALAEGSGLAFSFAAWHAIAYGGIGMVTVGMMARASLGHTGRSVLDPPKMLGPLFLALAIGAAIRSLIPALLPAWHGVAVAVSQLIWIGVFSLLFLRYLPLWIGPSKGR
ncbi:MAG: NnrS family protein [Gammaproteobacteria bacterium]|nr:NnrS family protein [Gammaproteobacteria bacterium]MBU1961689.1 NnrS family protein [Gammaproteobacteria bacterium]